MMVDGIKIAISVNGIPIRLPDERWEHIIDGHANLANYRDDVLDVIQEPDEVRFGYGGAFIALRGYGKQRYLAVIYKEVSEKDGFIITARFVRKKPGGRILWRKY